MSPVRRKRRIVKQEIIPAPPSTPVSQDCEDEQEQEQQDDNSFVKSYMKQQYRPYSIKDIQLNLHNKYNKNKLTSILDSLVAEGELVTRVIGKSTYYVYKQLTGEDSCTSLERYQELEEKVKQLNRDVQQTKQRMCLIGL